MTFNFYRSVMATSLGLTLALGMVAPSVFAEPHKQVQADAEHYKDEALKLLERLVNITPVLATSRA